MMLIFNIAWKNIWRNRFRSLIIMSAITLGIFAGLFLVAFSKGMGNQRVAAALNTEISHIQIHQPDFIIREDIKMVISPVGQVEKILKANGHVASYSSRILLNSIASSAETGANVKINGIDPVAERTVTDLYSKITEGSYFGKNGRNPVVISQKLVEKLKLKMNSKIVLQIQDLHGNVAPAAFRIGGIYRTNNSVYDEFNVFVKKSDLYSLTGLDSTSAHEVAILLKDYLQSKKVATELQKEFPKLEVKTWKERSVMLSYLNDAMDQYLYIIMIIILIALLFGIVNTMMMAVLERIKELGMLMAIGMSRMRVFWMIVLETVLLSLTGAVLGIVLGILTIHYFGRVGIDLSIWGKGLEMLGYDPVVYTSIDNFFVAIVVVLVVATGIISAIFPAVKALRIKPVEALRDEK
jgi:ABC-type lipoprotein release transport system permease subunit